MDGIPAFLKCFILLPTNQKIQGECAGTCCMTYHQENKLRTKLGLQLITTILSYATAIMFPQTWSLLNLVRCSLYILEDNEAVIKMIMNRRSPTMRHVSPNPQSCAWLVIWPKNPNQICWNRKPNSQTWRQKASSHVMSGTIFSICSIFAFSAQASCTEKMSKRMQYRTGEERIAAKSKPTLNLVSKTEASSSTALSPNASNRPVILRAPCQQCSNLIASAGRNQPLGVQIKMTQRQVLKCGLQMHRWTNVRRNSLL